MMPLDSTDVSLSWVNARACAEACAHVYGLTPYDCATSEDWIIDSRTDAHALVQDRGNCIAVCFRGSKDAEDYIQDGKFDLTDLMWTRGNDVARVHDGFLEDFDAINVKLIAALKGLPRKPIFITGHSLGAALATLCALEFQYQHFPVAGVYTFGSPRVGNGAFCDLYDDILKDVTFRVINQNDIVPRVPPLLNGYRHVGNCVFLYSWLNSFGVNPALATRAVSNLLGFWNAFRSIHDVLITDHHIGSYQQKILNLH